MKSLLHILVLGICLGGLACSAVTAQAARDADFQVAVYGDTEREVACLGESVQQAFVWTAWAHLPPSAGLAYATFRLRLPADLVLLGPPRLGAMVGDLIRTEFADGTFEWNLLVTGCPGGWVMLLEQDARLDSEAPATLGLVANRSLIRDCGFVLNDVTVAGELALNDPACGTVATAATDWGSLKGRFR